MKSRVTKNNHDKNLIELSSQYLEASILLNNYTLQSQSPYIQLKKLVFYSMWILEKDDKITMIDKLIELNSQHLNAFIALKSFEFQAQAI